MARKATCKDNRNAVEPVRIERSGMHRKCVPLAAAGRPRQCRSGCEGTKSAPRPSARGRLGRPVAFIEGRRTYDRASAGRPPSCPMEPAGPSRPHAGSLRTESCPSFSGVFIRLPDRQPPSSVQPASIFPPQKGIVAAPLANRSSASVLDPQLRRDNTRMGGPCPDPHTSWAKEKKR